MCERCPRPSWDSVVPGWSCDVDLWLVGADGVKYRSYLIAESSIRHAVSNYYIVNVWSAQLELVHTLERSHLTTCSIGGFSYNRNWLLLMADLRIIFHALIFHSLCTHGEIRHLIFMSYRFNWNLTGCSTKKASWTPKLRPPKCKLLANSYRLRLTPHVLLDVSLHSDDSLPEGRGLSISSHHM